MMKLKQKFKGAPSEGTPIAPYNFGLIWTRCSLYTVSQKTVSTYFVLYVNKPISVKIGIDIVLK